MTHAYIFAPFKSVKTPFGWSHRLQNIFEASKMLSWFWSMFMCLVVYVSCCYAPFFFSFFTDVLFLFFRHNCCAMDCHTAPKQIHSHVQQWLYWIVYPCILSCILLMEPKGSFLSHQVKWTLNATGLSKCCVTLCCPYLWGGGGRRDAWVHIVDLSLIACRPKVPL